MSAQQRVAFIVVSRIAVRALPSHAMKTLQILRPNFRCSSVVALARTLPEATASN